MPRNTATGFSRSDGLWLVIGILIIVAVGYVFAAWPVKAEDRGAWFKSLMRPDTGTSCCSAADCRRTVAQWQAGEWVADADTATPLSVPSGKIVRNPPSIDGEAYVCVYTGQVLCFIPPSPGT